MYEYNPSSASVVVISPFLTVKVRNGKIMPNTVEVNKAQVKSKNPEIHMILEIPRFR